MSANDATSADESSGASQIGPKVRAAREAQKMTLRELARRTDVSPSFLSQLERNKVNASVGTLYALVDALGLSVDQLMSGKQHEGGSRSAGGSVGWQTPPAATPFLSLAGRTVEHPFQPAHTRARIQFPGVVWERLTADADTLVDFLHVEYAPGSASCAPDDMMRHGGQEYGFVLSGELNLQLGFDTYVVKPGDAVTFDSMTPHRLSNSTDEPCAAIWVVLGRRDDERARDVPHPSNTVTHLPSLGS